MKKIFAFFLPALLMAPQVLALSVVKVESVQTYSGVVFKGSGFGFRYQNQAWVVTSDHVELHDSSDETMLMIYSEPNISAKAHYIVSDFGFGLGLLRLDDQSQAMDWPELGSVHFRDANLNESVVTYGYPGASRNTLIRDGDGVASVVNKPCELLIQVEKMTEVTGSHGEFGMSGGPGLSATGEFLGILSFQIFSETPNAIQNDLMLIPGTVVQFWLRNVLLDPAHFLPDFYQTVYQQLWKDPTFSSGKISFDFVDTKSTGTSDLVLTPDKLGSDHYFSNSADLKIYSDFLAKQPCEIILIGFRHRGDFAGTILAGRGPNYVTAARLYARGDLEPVNQAWCNQSEDAKDNLNRIYQQLQNFHFPSSFEQNFESLIYNVEMLASVIREDPFDDDPRRIPDYVQIKPTDLDWLMNAPENQPFWQALKKAGLDQQLLGILKPLRDQLQWLSI